MKTTFKFIIAAMAAVSVFASCRKEMSIETANNTNDGVRVISAQFDNSTKSTLDSFTPKFNNGDQIKVANGVGTPETLTVSVDGSGNATFTTALTGPLTAVYPADAAKLNGNAIEGVLVKTVQDGTFANANIAMATITAESSSATFQGQTAVFRITPGAGASTKYVEVITAGPEIANTTTTDFTKKNKIHVATTTTTAAYEVFVSVLVPTGLKLRDLSFADGSNIKTVNNTTAIAANTIYTIEDDSGWDQPYVEIEMTVGTETQKYKWATMNIGANSATEVGQYFAWGGVNGQVPSSSTFNPGFSWSNCPFAATTNPKFNKYVPDSKTSYLADGFSGDTKTVLDLTDDAANANWGGSWRMPTKEEFDALCALQTKSWKTNYNASGVNGYEFTDANSNSIFLPAAGYGFGTVFDNASDLGYYWSSSLYTDDPIFAYYLDFIDGHAYTNFLDRYYGHSVRALSE